MQPWVFIIIIISWRNSDEKTNDLCVSWVFEIVQKYVYVWKMTSKKGIWMDRRSGDGSFVVTTTRVGRLSLIHMMYLVVYEIWEVL